MNDLIAVAANVSLALSFLVALVFGITQVSAVARDRRERFGLDTLRMFQSREFAEVMHYLIVPPGFPATRAEFGALTADRQIMFLQFGQQMESLGLQVSSKVIDLELVERTFGSFIMTAWSSYKPMVLELRESTPDPYLAEYFQWLAERLAERMRLSPRQPMYKVAA